MSCYKNIFFDKNFRKASSLKQKKFMHLPTESQILQMAVEHTAINRRVNKVF